MNTKMTLFNLRSARIFNEYGLLDDGEPSIHYRTPGRVEPPGWYLWIKNRRIPGETRDIDGGKLFMERFDGGGIDGAKSFAAKVCGVTEWEKSPFHNRGRYPTWIPKGTTKRALDRIEKEDAK